MSDPSVLDAGAAEAPTTPPPVTVTYPSERTPSAPHSKWIMLAAALIAGGYVTAFVWVWYKIIMWIIALL